MTTSFTLTEDHIKLVNNFYVGWNSGEYGAPCIDCKRPYGNSNVEEDICEILGKKKISVNYQELYKTEDLEEAARLHKETETALEIILCTKSFIPGEYIKTDEYNSMSWKLA